MKIFKCISSIVGVDWLLMSLWLDWIRLSTISRMFTSCWSSLQLPVTSYFFGFIHECLYLWSLSYLSLSYQQTVTPIGSEPPSRCRSGSAHALWFWDGKMMIPRRPLQMWSRAAVLITASICCAFAPSIVNCSLCCVIFPSCSASFHESLGARCSIQAKVFLQTLFMVFSSIMLYCLKTQSEM